MSQMVEDPPSGSRFELDLKISRRNDSNDSSATKCEPASACATFSSALMRAVHMRRGSRSFSASSDGSGVAPLMPAFIRQEFASDKSADQGTSTIVSSPPRRWSGCSAGWLCDRIGPRCATPWLLILGSLPVMGIGFSHDYTTFSMFRLAIGASGASFVITQYATSVMFRAEYCLELRMPRHCRDGATLGGGVTQISWVMPLLFTGFVSLGASAWLGWRIAMFVPGVLMLATGIAYNKLTDDTADGDFGVNFEPRARSRGGPRPMEPSHRPAAIRACGPCS